MNLRKKYLVITVRVLLGLMFVGSGIGGLMGGSDLKGVPESMIPTMKVLWATGIFQMIKVTEIVAGLMLVAGFLPALALLFLAPVCVGILVVTSRVAPEGMIAGVVVTVFTVYLGYAYWHKYQALFQRT